VITASGRRVAPRLGHDRGHGFDPHGMVHVEHDDLSNLVHLVDGFVDLSAGDVLAAGFDHVLLDALQLDQPLV
jgi:hypothetical protein